MKILSIQFSLGIKANRLLIPLTIIDMQCHVFCVCFIVVTKERQQCHTIITYTILIRNVILFYDLYYILFKRWQRNMYITEPVTQFSDLLPKF